MEVPKQTPEQKFHAAITSALRELPGFDEKNQRILTKY